MGFTSWKNRFNMKYGFDKDEAHSIEEIADLTGYSAKGLKTIYEKGEGAYFTNPQSVRPQVKNPYQWAMARVYSAVMGGKSEKIDKAHLIKGGGLREWSDPDEVARKARRYFGKDVPIYTSDKPSKKYMLQNPDGKWVYFGAYGMEDFTKHKDEARRKSYLARARGIRGQWKDNPYSPNNLSINLLW
jgi:hypothetical protein